MQLSVYIPDTVVNKKIMERVKILMEQYNVSLSEIVSQALRDIVSVQRPDVKKGDFRNAKIGRLR